MKVGSVIGFLLPFFGPVCVCVCVCIAFDAVTSTFGCLCRIILMNKSQSKWIWIPQLFMSYKFFNATLPLADSDLN